MHFSSRVDQRPAKELGARRPTRRKAERGHSVAYSIRFTGALKLYQYGLTSSQPDGDVKVANRSVVWIVTLGLNCFLVLTFIIIQDSASATRRGYRKKRKAPRPAKRRNGEEARRRPSHIGCAILGRSTCFTDNLVQHGRQACQAQTHQKKCSTNARLQLEQT